MGPTDVIDLDDFRQRCGRLSVRQACLPAGVDPIEQDALDAVVRRRRTLEDGEALFREGDAMRGLFVIRRGAFKTLRVTSEGDVHVLAFHLAGELMGLDALGDGRHRCDAVALAPAEVCELDYARLIDAASALPVLRAQLHRVVGQAIGRDLDHALLLTRRLAHERVAGFLEDLCERFCLLGQPSTAFRLPMSREDIARHLGLTIESVSRALTRLQDEGVLFVRGRQLDVLDPPALARLAGEAA